MKNEFKLEIDSKLKNVACVRLLISSFISNLNITLDEIDDVKIAVSEAITNAIEHGYNLDENKKVIITCIIDDEEENIEIFIKDFGIGIEDITLAMTAEYTTKPEEEHAGLGFTIMESVMDEIIVDSTINNGTEIRLKKYIKSKKSN